MKHKDKSLEGWGRDKARERYADGGTTHLVGKDSVNKLFDRATEPVSKAIKSAASSVKERFSGKPDAGSRHMPTINGRAKQEDFMARPMKKDEPAKTEVASKPSTSGSAAAAADGPTIPKIDYNKYDNDTPAPPMAERKNFTDGLSQKAAPVPTPKSRPASAPSAAPAQASPAPAEKEGFKAKNFQDTFTMKRGGLAKKKGK